MIRALLAVALVCTVAFDASGVVFALLGQPISMQYADWGFPGFNAVIGLAAVVLAWPIIRTHPRHLVGWLLLWVGFISAVQFAAHYYGIYGLLAAPGSVPAANVGSWLEGWLWVPTVGCAAALLPLVFPTGRPPTRRWVPVIWLALVAQLVASLGYMLVPGALTRVPAGGVNPVAPSGDPGLANAMIAVGMLLFVASLLLGAASLVVRFRRSRGIERQQLKWLALAAAIAATAFAVYAILLVTTGLVYNPMMPVVAVSFLGMIVAVSIAILRHRLLDIDLLINRALVYAGVTVVLAAVYVGTVLVLQSALISFTEQRGLVVAVSTLLVAALFTPVRRRMQRAVDLRFYRSRYDAERVIQQFAATLRDEVDLPHLTDELIDVVEQSMRPRRVRVWVRHAAEACRS
jgi:hypothetical protein